MKKNKSRILSILLTLVLVLTMFAAMPLTASAAGEECEITASTDAVGAPTGLYDTVGDAYNAVSAAGAGAVVSIKLLGNDISSTSQLLIKDGKKITIDMNGKTLNMNVSGTDAIHIQSGELTISGDGTFNIKVSGIGLSCMYVDSGTVSVTGKTRINALSESIAGIGVFNGGSITKTKDAQIHASAQRYGLYVDNGKATVSSVTNTDSTGTIGVYVKGGSSEVCVTGDVTAAGDNCNGIDVSDDALVDVGGDIKVTGSFSTGVNVNNGSIAVALGDSSSGIYGVYGAVVNIGGSITATGASCIGVAVNCGTFIALDDNDIGICGTDDTAVNVGGDVTVTGNNGYGVIVRGGSIISSVGYLSAAGESISGLAAGSAIAKIAGNVTVTGDNTIGASADGGGNIVIDGTLLGPSYYVYMGGSSKHAAEHNASSSIPGYLEYSNGGSFIWIKMPALEKGSLKYSLKAKAYTGKRLGVTVTPKNGAGKVNAIYYKGINGTKYNKSMTKPKNIGSYTITVDVADGSLYGGAKNFTLGTFKIVPSKSKVTGITTEAKQMTVKWKKVSKVQKVSKYQIRYRVVGTSKWKVKSFSASKSTAVIKKLKKGKAYQVQVRSYKKISKTKLYSAWSKTKTSGKIK